MDWSAKHTIAGIATPLGKGGVAIVRVSGSLAKSVADRLFQCRGSKKTFVSHQLYAGSMVHPQTLEVIDQGMLVYMQAPRTYTGEDVVEFHVHGGNVSPKATLQAILSLTDDVVLAEAGEFTFRAFINGKINLLQAEAVHQIVDSQNDLQRDLALRQLRGDWQHELDAVAGDLKQLLSHVEGDLDFPSDGIETSEHSTRLGQLRNIQKTLLAWKATTQWQAKARERLLVALVGAPNVGKSTIFNAILKEERSITDERAGTTRDFVEASLEIGGIPLRFVDTAGLHLAIEDVERKGIAKTMDVIEKADLLLWVVTPKTDPKKMVADFSVDQAQMVVVNKLDLMESAAAKSEAISAVKSAMGHVQHVDVISCSAVEGCGLDDLNSALEKWCQEQTESLNAAKIVLNDRQAKTLDHCLSEIEQAEAKMIEVFDQSKHNQTPDSWRAGNEDVIAEHLWSASRHLQHLTGNDLAPEVVEAIFSQFCIGK